MANSLVGTITIVETLSELPLLQIAFSIGKTKAAVFPVPV